MSQSNITRRNFLAGCGCAAAMGLFKPALSFAQEDKTDSDELTFFVTADTHYGRFQAENNSKGNKSTIALMNAAPGKVKYPDFIGGGLVKKPKGVLVAGDQFLEPGFLQPYVVDNPSVVEQVPLE